MTKNPVETLEEFIQSLHGTVRPTVLAIIARHLDRMSPLGIDHEAYVIHRMHEDAGDQKIATIFIVCCAVDFWGINAKYAAEALPELLADPVLGAHAYIRQRELPSAAAQKGLTTWTNLRSGELSLESLYKYYLTLLGGSNQDT